MATERQIAELGVPYATELTFSLRADVTGAAMHKIGTHTTEVNCVATAPLPDSMFEIPEDYTLIKR